MKKIKITDEQIQDDKIIIPILFNSLGFIIDENELLYSSQLKIDKNIVNDGEYVEKTYECNIQGCINSILDQYRELYINKRIFSLNKIYILENVSSFDGGHEFDIFYFIKEQDGIYAYFYPINSKYFKTIEMSYILNREQLESIFSPQTTLLGYYVIEGEYGLKSAYNKIDGTLLDEYHIPTDERIVRNYNFRDYLIGGFLKQKMPNTPIEDITNYSITNELMIDSNILIYITDKIYFSSFSIVMNKIDEFDLRLTRYAIPYFENDLLKNTQIKKLTNRIF